MTPRTTFHIDGGDAGCLDARYIMVSDGVASYAIRSTARHTQPYLIPLVDLESCGCSFTFAYLSSPLLTSGISVAELGKFVHGQRMILANIIGADKLADIDRRICKTIKDYTEWNSSNT